VVDVLIGTSSRELLEAGSVVVVPDPAGRAAVKAFDGSVTVR
jgi:hypothetical protein